MRLCLGLLLLFFTWSTHAAPLVVAIDPGHGGTDTGAKREDLRESELVLRIANELNKLLENDTRFIPLLTRTADHVVALEYRTEFAEKKKAQVFVSIHANSAPISQISGTEIYFQNQLPADQESLFLADRENEGAIRNKDKEDGDVSSIIKDLKRHHQTLLSFNLAKDIFKNWPARKNGKIHVRQGPFHVITEIDMPSVLVETGYLTNAEESHWLAQKDAQKQIALAIYNGLIQFKSKWDHIPKGK